MTANAITMSSRLETAGLEKKIADAIASEIVDFNDEQNASTADVVNLKADIARIETKLNIVIAFNLAILFLVFSGLKNG